MAGSTKYRAQFPRAMYTGNLQSEDNAASNSTIAQARDYNVHDQEIRAVQSTIGVDPTGSPIGTIQSRLSDIETDFQVDEVRADGFVSTFPSTPCGASWAVPATPTLEDLLEQVIYGTGVLDANLLCNLADATGLSLDHRSPHVAGGGSTPILLDEQPLKVGADLGQPLVGGTIPPDLDGYAGLNAKPFTGGIDRNQPEAFTGRSDDDLLSRRWWALGGPHGVLAPESPLAAPGRVLTSGFFTATIEGMLNGAVPFYHYDAPVDGNQWDGPLNFDFTRFPIQGTSPTGVIDLLPPGDQLSSSLVFAEGSPDTPTFGDPLTAPSGEYTPWYTYPFQVRDVADVPQATGLPGTGLLGGGNVVWQVPPQVIQFLPVNPFVFGGPPPGPTGIAPTGGIVRIHMNPKGQFRMCADGPVVLQGPGGKNPGGGSGDDEPNVVPLPGRQPEITDGVQFGGGWDFWAHKKSTETHVLSAGIYHDRLQSYLGLRESGITDIIDAAAVQSNVLQASFWKGNRHISLGFDTTIYSIEDANFGDTLTIWGKDGFTTILENQDQGAGRKFFLSSGTVSVSSAFSKIELVFMQNPAFPDIADGRWVEMNASSGGGTSGLTPVSTATLASPAASVDISGIDSSSRLWLLVLSHLQPANASQSPEALLSIGGVFRSDAFYEHHSENSNAGASGYSGTNGIGQTSATIGGGVSWSNTAGVAGQLRIWFQNPSGTTERKIIHADGFFWDSTPRLTLLNHRAAYDNSTAALDAIRIRMTSGNIQAGLIQDLYKFVPPT